MTLPTRQDPPLARLVGRRPQRGASDAAKTVVADVQQLLRAEIGLAKAEIAEGAKAKAMGAGFFIVAGVVGWLAINAFLVFLGFVFATFMPAWAASGLVLLLLLILIGILGFLGMRKLKQEASLTETKASIETSKAAATQAVDRAKAHASEGVEEARGTVLEAVADVRERVSTKVAQLRGTATSSIAATSTTSATSITAPTAVSEVGQVSEVSEVASTPEVSPRTLPASPVQKAQTAYPAGSLRPPSADPAGGGAETIRFPEPPRSAEESQS